jgi:rod shape-determining protein MreD
VKGLGIVIALAVALVLQTTIGRFGGQGLVVVDFVLVAVVASGLVAGPAAGTLAGTFGGLVQDALSSGVLGIGGLAKSIVGFLVGVASAQFIVAQPLPRMVVLAAATFVHAGIFMGLYELLDLRDFGSPLVAIAGQALGNAVAGVVGLQLAAMMPGASTRRQSRPRAYR